MRLRDIGFYTGFAKASPMGISPDRKRAAFVITRADPVTNLYCQALVVLALDRAGQPRLLDTGGEYIPASTEIRGNQTITGAPAVISPKWSPDGQWLAYLKRTGGVTGAWLVRTDGSASRTLLSLASDIEDLAWTTDGTSIVFMTATSLEREKTRIAAAAKDGFLYDDHLVPLDGATPLPAAPTTRDYYAVKLGSGEISIASPSEQALLDGSVANGRPRNALKFVRGPAGAIAWTERRKPDHLMSIADLWVRSADGTSLRCPDVNCQGQLRGIEDLWWFGKDLVFLKREGWGYSQLTLYRWNPGRAPIRELVTDDLLMGCTPVGSKLLCTREGAAQPRELVTINPQSGKVTRIYDPNPGFAAFRRGRVQRLHWRNQYGFESFGDLILPPGYKPGDKIPLIVVQYISRGFLRGGVGDEYPIYLFAERGFAVLSVQSPPFFYESLPDQGWKRWEDAEAENVKGWRDRWSHLSTVIEGVKLVVARGIADPNRIGITGLSDGATTVQFGLVNAPGFFTAASVSTCCMDETSTAIYGGTAWYNELRSFGYPSLTQADPAFWRGFSIAANAKQINVPLLMQVAGHEFILALETYARLKDAKQPVEMFVFPDEYHIKSQPAHRLAIYQRNVRWFEYWLKNERSSEPGLAAQYARWDQLRATAYSAPKGP